MRSRRLFEPGEPTNEPWSIDDPSLKADERAGLADPEEGLRSHESDALGADRYPQE